MMARYGLCDDQWNRIKDFLPGREGHVGDYRLRITGFSLRLFCIAIVPVSMRDLPARFGDWKVRSQAVAALV